VRGEARKEGVRGTHQPNEGAKGGSKHPQNHTPKHEEVTRKEVRGGRWAV
jgi:hypothetical protein